MGFIEERFEINPNSTGITETDGQGALWADIWDFKVQPNTQIKLKPTDIFSCYLIDDGGSVEMPKTTQVRVVRRDVANEDAEPILTTVLYQSIKAFTDKDKLMHLSIPWEIIVDEYEHIVVMINGNGATGDTDASLSHFKIQTTRRRKALS